MNYRWRYRYYEDWTQRWTSWQYADKPVDAKTEAIRRSRDNHFITEVEQENYQGQNDWEYAP